MPKDRLQVNLAAEGARVVVWDQDEESSGELAEKLRGNGLDATCGVDEICADVATCAQGGNDRPVLHRTPCGTSYELGSGMPGRSCSICTLD